METRGRSSSRRNSSLPAANSGAPQAPSAPQAPPTPHVETTSASVAAANSTSGPLTRSRAAKGKRAAGSSTPPSDAVEAVPTRPSKRARTARQQGRPAGGWATRRTSARRSSGSANGASQAAESLIVPSSRPGREMSDPTERQNEADRPDAPPPPPPSQPHAQGSGRTGPAGGLSNGDESEEHDVSLQGLLRRLGAGLDDMFPQAGSSQTRLRNILSVLRGSAEEPARLDALTQLCDYLSVGTEESMVSFSIDSFVPPLVALLGEGNSADTMLLAARALTHLMDALPASASAISQNNAATPLCANLLTIEYIDLAEQSLAALEKLSIDYPQSIVRAGGFAAALSFIDFFSTGVQRVAAMTTCNMCRAPPVESLDMIVDMLPTMMSLLNNDDQRIRESMMLGFSRLADSFKTASDKLERFCGGEDATLVERVVSLIVPTSPPSLAPQSYSAALRLLATLNRGSAKLSAKLLAAEALIFKLQELLAVSSSPHAADCLNLADSLLPETAPDAENKAAQTAISATISIARASRRRRSSSSLAAFAAVDSTRRKYLAENPDALSFFGRNLLPSLYAFYQSSADATCRRTTLSVIAKVLGLAPASVLKPLIVSDDTAPGTTGRGESTAGPSFAPFAASLLGENCSVSESLAGLCLAHFSLSKLPEVRTLFTREGVVHEIARLATNAESKKEPDAVVGAKAGETVAPPASGTGRGSDDAGASAPASGAGAEALSATPIAEAPPRDSSGGSGALVPLSRSSTGDFPRDATGNPTSSHPLATTVSGANIATSGASSSALPAQGSSDAPPVAPEAFQGTRPGLPQRLATLRAPNSAVPEISQAAVSELAADIVFNYIKDASANTTKDGDGVFGSLSSVAEMLKTVSGSVDPATWESPLATLACTLGQNAGVTTFELTRSGIVSALEGFLRADSLSSSVRTQRTVMFVDCVNRHSLGGAFAVLVARSLGAFSAEEKLPVCIADGHHSSGPGQGSVSVGSGLRQLVQPFKLCLKRAPAPDGGNDLRDYAHHVVLIEPLATMASVEEFLWGRVQNLGSQSEGDEPFHSRHRGTSTRSGIENVVDDLVLDDEDEENPSDEADDDASPMEDDDEEHDNEEEHEGDVPEGMFSMEEDVDREGGYEEDGDDARQSDGGFSSGSEDVIGEENEDDDDGDDMDDDDAFGGPLATSLPAVELDHDALAQFPRPASGRKTGTDQSSTPTRGAGSSSLSRGGGEDGVAGGGGRGRGTRNVGSDAASGPPRSYAAALASGIQQARGESGTLDTASQRRLGRNSSSSSPRLIFRLNDRVVPQESSILHAVLQSRSDGLTMGPRLWSEVYTITYSRATPAQQDVSGGGSDESGTGPLARGSPVGGVDAPGMPSSAVQADSGSRATRRSRRLRGRSASADMSAVALEALNGRSLPAPPVPDSAQPLPGAPASGSPVEARPVDGDLIADDVTPEGPKEPSAAASAVASNLEQPAAAVVVPKLTDSEILYRSTAFVPSLSISTDLPESIRSVVCLLKRLNWIFRVMSSASHDGGAVMTPGGTDEPVVLNMVEGVDFVSQKITAKLYRQLSDPLALCGGAIPSWCHVLAQEASFLLPFETRQILFQSTALGVARALNLLQLRSDASSVAGDVARHGILHRTQAMRDTEARINRIQRQKVRIHRSRVLESAMQVMTMYASQTTVLEVEYFDEVGTGLGPTLEFYTLVSRELQRMNLGLWRGKESMKAQERKDKRVGHAQSNPISVPTARGSSGASARVPQMTTRTRRRAGGGHTQDRCTPIRRSDITESDVEYVVPTGSGLVPSCIPQTDTGNPEFANRLAYFPFIGQLIAKALSDGRLLDLRLSPIFAKLLLAFCSIAVARGIESGHVGRPSRREEETHGILSGSASKRVGRVETLAKQLETITDAELWREFAEGSPGLSLLREVDPQLASSLQNVLDLAQGDSKDAVEDLCLSFVLPENEHIELCPNGAKVAVNADNAVEYVAALVRFVLCCGVRRQAEALLCGFCDVLDLKSLLLFQANELELLICGPSFEEWTNEFLVQATRCDHGYRHESNAILYLFRVLSELESEDQQRFIMFATGSPALPVGGLKGLHPRLTIVKRTPEGGRSPDECLPTVMTCTNYFKLPDYSSYEITKSRLLYAMREGQGSFHLS